LYILFVGPPQDPLDWSDENIAGAHRFLHRVWRLVDRHAEGLAKEPPGPVTGERTPAARELHRKVHQTILKATHDIEDRLQMTTAVAALMELVNEIYRVEADVSQGPSRATLRFALDTLVRLLDPFTPHVAEEMAARLAPEPASFPGLVRAPWPVADP